MLHQSFPKQNLSVRSRDTECKCLNIGCLVGKSCSQVKRQDVLRSQENMAAVLTKAIVVCGA